MPALDLVIRNTSEVLTVQGSLGTPGDALLTPLPQGVIGIAKDRIVYLGSESKLPAGSRVQATQVMDAQGGFVGPGFVDPHTHLVFGGERSSEFELRCRGASYLDIARAGGGILSTVRATRANSEDALVALALPRLRRLLEQGVTCAEVKSGYGLSLEDELKILRVIRRLGLEQPITLVPTLLCAHAIPEEMREQRDRYVRLCVDEIIPAASEAGLAKFCDVFVEQGAFTVAEGRQILAAGVQAGLIPRVHANQLGGSGGAFLAAELGAASADHLEHVSGEEIKALAAAKVTAVLMPTTTVYLRQQPAAPGRELVDAGVSVALGTNLNPGSAMSENIALTIGLGCLQNSLSAAEAYWALTRGAALALRMPEYGRLTIGGPADLVVFGSDSYRHLPYHLGINHVKAVIKSGRVVVDHLGKNGTICEPTQPVE
jgi:imidazolonepropionase